MLLNITKQEVLKKMIQSWVLPKRIILWSRHHHLKEQVFMQYTWVMEVESGKKKAHF